MDDGSLLGLEALLGEPRLKRYLDRYDGNRTYALRLYRWNLAAASAFWGPISVLEVATRNSIHHLLVERTGQGDWWNDTSVRLCDNERYAIDSAISTLQRRGCEEPNSDQVVAATSFGLWVGLTGPGIARDRLLSYETTLWQPRLQNAFPHRGNARRKYIHSKLNGIRFLRNRIAHHEPIYGAPLSGTYSDLLELASMIHPDVRTYLDTYSRVPRVLEKMKEAITLGEVEL